MKKENKRKGRKEEAESSFVAIHRRNEGENERRGGKAQDRFRGKKEDPLEKGIKIKNRCIRSDADSFPREKQFGQKHSRGIRNIAYSGFPARLTSAVKRYDVKSASMQNARARAYSSARRRRVEERVGSDAGCCCVVA